MNKNTFKIFLAVLFFVNMHSIYGQCPAGNIILNTQEDVDNFAVNYPNCTAIQANLIIQETPITNLNGLSQIESIGLNLAIKDNHLLTSLNGLNNLETAYALLIERNHALSNLEGLESLSNLNGDLYINNNHFLESLDGLENLEYIRLGLGIFHNPLLTSLMGLSGLTEIEGDLFIENQNTLTSLDGLDNLTSMHGTLHIGINFELIDINGIRNIDATTIGRLQLFSNYELSICNVQSICEYIELPNYNGIISNNVGCRDKDEVEISCALGAEENQLARLKIFPNPINDTFEISDLKQGTIEIIDSQGRTVKEMIVNQNSYSISELASGIYFIKIISEKASVTKQLIKT